MLIGYTLVYGVYTVFGASVSFFTDYYGFTTSETGNFALCFIFCGLGGTIFYSLLITYTSKYKLFYLLCALLVNVGLVGAIISLQKGPDVIVWVYVCVSFAGFHILPIIPLSYDFGA